jgi:DNA primase
LGFLFSRVQQFTEFPVTCSMGAHPAPAFHGQDRAASCTKRLCKLLRPPETAMAGDQPGRYVAKAALRERAGRIYVDYLRNIWGATAIGTYSTRARPGAPVSTPLSWEELSPAIRPSDFTVGSVPARLRAVGRDPWADMARVDQALPTKPKARRRS